MFNLMAKITILFVTLSDFDLFMTQFGNGANVKRACDMLCGLLPQAR